MFNVDCLFVISIPSYQLIIYCPCLVTLNQPRLEELSSERMLVIREIGAILYLTSITITSKREKLVYKNNMPIVVWYYLITNILRVSKRNKGTTIWFLR
jgi:hypothetical protein